MFIPQVNMTSNNYTNAEAQAQAARAQLREGFLKAIVELTGRPCKILTYEQSELPATFSGWNPDGTEILVHDLKTPAFTTATSALLRVPDLIAVKFEKDLGFLSQSGQNTEKIT